MRQPEIYTPDMFKGTTCCQREINPGVWVEARPVGHTLRPLSHRITTAWRVFIGRYDALRWQGQESTKAYE